MTLIYGSYIDLFSIIKTGFAPKESRTDSGRKSLSRTILFNQVTKSLTTLYLILIFGLSHLVLIGLVLSSTSNIQAKKQSGNMLHCILRALTSEKLPR